jgi:antitoxin component of MazEF toxin-antitoxin module
MLYRGDLIMGIKTYRIRNNGGNHVVTIPQNVMNDANLELGDEVVISYMPITGVVTLQKLQKFEKIIAYQSKVRNYHKHIEAGLKQDLAPVTDLDGRPINEDNTVDYETEGVEQRTAEVLAKLED